MALNSVEGDFGSAEDGNPFSKHLRIEDASSPFGFLRFANDFLEPRVLIAQGCYYRNEIFPFGANTCVLKVLGLILPEKDRNDDIAEFLF